VNDVIASALSDGFEVRSNPPIYLWVLCELTKGLLRREKSQDYNYSPVTSHLYSTTAHPDVALTRAVWMNDALL